MSENKTPREMAEEWAAKYANGLANEDYADCYSDCRLSFLAGIKAGAKMGWVARGYYVIEEDRGVTVDEWWASLEGE